MNQKLKHITVLEEAHNLLRNHTSSGISSEEGGNSVGKSVEMITNSIAEMRTYGEGFIIVDQSPNAIDISAIRNTNTKIIMRLPEESDRKQVGKSAALKDNQIDELAKLVRGVAVVYQNNWLDPVLCSIHKANVEENPYIYKLEKKKGKTDYSDLLKVLMKNRVDEKLEYDIDNIENTVKVANFSSKTKIELRQVLEELREGKTPTLLKEEGFNKLSGVVVDVLNCADNIQKYSNFGENWDLLQQELNREIERNAWNMSKEMKLAVSQCILRQLVENDNNQMELYSKWREFAVEQRKLV